MPQRIETDLILVTATFYRKGLVTYFNPEEHHWADDGEGGCSAREEIPFAPPDSHKIRDDSAQYRITKDVLCLDFDIWGDTHDWVQYGCNLSWDINEATGYEEAFGYYCYELAQTAKRRLEEIDRVAAQKEQERLTKRAQVSKFVLDLEEADLEPKNKFEDPRVVRFLTAWQFAMTFYGEDGDYDNELQYLGVVDFDKVAGLAQREKSHDR